MASVVRRQTVSSKSAFYKELTNNFHSYNCLLRHVIAVLPKSIFRYFTAASAGNHSSFGICCSAEPQNGRSEAKYEFKLQVTSRLVQISKYYTGLLTDWSFGKRKTPNNSSRSVFQIWLKICIRRVLSRERSWRRIIARGLLVFQRDKTRTGDTVSVIHSFRTLKL